MELESKLGVYGQALIKKYGRCWPKGVPGDLIDEHFMDKEVGYSKSLELRFKGKKIFIHCMKEGKWISSCRPLAHSMRCMLMQLFGGWQEGTSTSNTPNRS